jgi:hypothetical protein
MPAMSVRSFGVFAVAMGLGLLTAACAGRSGSPPGDAKASSPCVGLDACACRTAAGCKAVTEACYCATECDPAIRCICGGGKFLRCAPESEK